MPTASPGDRAGFGVSIEIVAGPGLFWAAA
jgi:hypothetical protein